MRTDIVVQFFSCCFVGVSGAGVEEEEEEEEELYT